MTMQTISVRKFIDSSIKVDYDEVNDSYKILTTDTVASATNLKVISVRKLLDSSIKVNYDEIDKVYTILL